MKKNIIIRKKFCFFLTMGSSKPERNPIKEVKTLNPDKLKLLVPTLGEPAKDIYKFYTGEQLFYLTSEGVELKSEVISKSKTYFLDAKFVSLEELQKEAQAEARAEPYTSDDARRMLKLVQADLSIKVIQDQITQYFFAFDENEHQLL